MAYILYHGNCFDGFGAAWAVKEGIGVKLGGLGQEDHYIPCNYGQPPAIIPDGQDVIMVDFSYPRAVLEDLRTRSRSLIVLDHHKTAMADLEGFNNAIFDMNHSGAYLAWKHFLGGTTPQLILYIEDRDLWKKQLPFTEEINAWIQSYDKTFDNFTMMANLMEIGDYRGQIVKEGEALLRFIRQKVQEVCEQASLQSLGGYDNIPVVNSSHFMSEVAHELLQRYPEAPFAAYYLDRSDGNRQYGLRSRKDFDCSVVAKQFGGGGHAQASGFEVKL